MTVRDIVFAAAGVSHGGGPVLHSRTYLPGETSASWPAATNLMLHGIGGSRTSVTTGWTDVSYPTENGNPCFGVDNQDGFTYVLTVSTTGFPQTTDLTGSNLPGVNVTISWPGGFVPSQEDPNRQAYFSAFSRVLAVNSIIVNSSFVQANFVGNILTAGPTLNGAASLAVYTSPISSFSDGPSASLVVNGATKTFAGQTAGGSNTYTDYTVNSGATTSGALSIPTGGQITVSWYA